MSQKWSKIGINHQFHWGFNLGAGGGYLVNLLTYFFIATLLVFSFLKRSPKDIGGFREPYIPGLCAETAMDTFYTMVNGDIGLKRFFSGNFGWKIYWEKSSNVLTTLRLYIKILVLIFRFGSWLMIRHQLFMHYIAKVPHTHLGKPTGR